jgi:hypothetical protein
MHIGYRTAIRASAILTILAVSAAMAQTSHSKTGNSPKAASARQDSVATDSLIQPNELAGLVTGPSAHRPTLIHVGFDTLYKGGHIPGSIYAGPASESDGLALLKKTLQPMSRQKPLVLYCGCCPWEDCPNVRAALPVVRSMGFKHVRSLYIARDLKQDWIDKGLPTAKGPTPSAIAH